VLATEAAALLHGRAAATAAEMRARHTFEDQTSARIVPIVEMPLSEIEKGLGVLAAFSEKANLVPTNREARNQIKARALKVNDRIVTDERMMLNMRDLSDEGVIKLSFGPNRHVLLKPFNDGPA